MIVNDQSRMYAALRCIESELEKEKPSIAAIRAIILEAGRELRPTKRAVDRLAAWAGGVNFIQFCLAYRDGQTLIHGKILIMMLLNGKLSRHLTKRGADYCPCP